jgi:hypothetical protein
MYIYLYNYVKFFYLGLNKLHVCAGTREEFVSAVMSTNRLNYPMSAVLTFQHRYDLGAVIAVLFARRIENTMQNQYSPAVVVLSTGRYRCGALYRSGTERGTTVWVGR